MQDNDAPVCLDRVNEMTAGDAEFLQEIVEIYVEDSLGLLRSLRETLERADWPTLEKEAHKLKGSSLNMGVPYVALLAQFLLETAKLGNPRSGANHTIEELRKPDCAAAPWVASVDDTVAMLNALGDAPDGALQGIDALDREFDRARVYFDRMTREAA